MKEKIIEFNKQFGLKTIFIKDSEIEGYSLGNTIYINENSSDIEKVNKHELLHYFENDETFQKIKDEILRLNKDKIDLIRSEYLLRYYGLYTEEEIKAGIIDTEIVIDILIDNFIFEYKDGLKLGDYVLKEISKNLESKRYLNISLTNQINNMNLSKWDKLFILNFYDGKEHILPQKEGRKEKIENDIKGELERLYSLSEKDFAIDSNSPDIIREYESEIKALTERGEDTTEAIKNKEESLSYLANHFSKELYEQYKHIVNFIKGEDYPDSFKALMLRETLSKTYKLDTSNGKKTIINKRNMHETIASHMILNKTVLDTIYNNINNYNNFANLYFAGLEIFNETIAKKNTISLDNVNTYGMGHWIKFDGKESNSSNYLKNAEELASLVKDTPWCTKTLASSQLAQGDFYVFVDNDNKPHIAVKTSGDEIDEVRGILNGNAQELEEDYRKIAISFLENNKNIKYGKEWLRKEEWNKRLTNYIKCLDENRQEEVDIKQLIDDLFIGNYEFRAHFDENTNKTKLLERVKEYRKYIAKYYGIEEDEVYIGDIDDSYDGPRKCPYKIIFGNVDIGNKLIDFDKLEEIYGSLTIISSDFESLGNLRYVKDDVQMEATKIKTFDKLTTIGGKLVLNMDVESLGSIRTVGGDVTISHTKIKDLGNLVSVGGELSAKDTLITNLGKLTSVKKLNLKDTNVKSLGNNITKLDGDLILNENCEDLGNLTHIGGAAIFSKSKLKSLGKITSVGGGLYIDNSSIEDLGDLTSIGYSAVFSHSKLKSLGKLLTIGGNADFRNSEVESLGNLTTIGGDAVFSDSPVQSLGKLTSVGKSLDLQDSNVTDLGELTTIGGNAVFSDSPVQSLGKLMTIGGDAYFQHSFIKSLGNLTTIGGNVIFSNSPVQSLGKLTSVGKTLDLQGSNVTDLGELTTIGGTASFSQAKIETLGKLKRIGGNLIVSGSYIVDLGDLEEIGGGADFKYSSIEQLGKLKKIGKYAYFANITNLGNLSSIGGSAYFSFSNVTDLGELTKIGRDAHFEYSKITDLKNLTEIGGTADFRNSSVINLGNLRCVRGNVSLNNSSIKSLGNLAYIGGDLYCNVNSVLEDFGNLTNIGGGLFIFNTKVTDFGNIQYIRDKSSSKVGSLKHIFKEEFDKDGHRIGKVKTVNKDNILLDEIDIKYAGSLKNISNDETDKEEGMKL